MSFDPSAALELMLRRFVSEDITADEFERWFLDYKRRQPRAFDERSDLTFPLFEAVDAYCGDSGLFDPADDLDATGLRAAARQALDEMTAGGRLDDPLGGSASAAGR